MSSSAWWRFSQPYGTGLRSVGLGVGLGLGLGLGIGLGVGLCLCGDGGGKWVWAEVVWGVGALGHNC